MIPHAPTPAPAQKNVFSPVTRLQKTWKT